MTFGNEIRNRCNCHFLHILQIIGTFFTSSSLHIGMIMYVCTMHYYDAKTSNQLDLFLSCVGWFACSTILSSSSLSTQVIYNGVLSTFSAASHVSLLLIRILFKILLSQNHHPLLLLLNRKQQGNLSSFSVRDLLSGMSSHKDSK